MARRRARNQGCSGETPGGHRFPICAARPPRARPPAPLPARGPWTGLLAPPRAGTPPGVGRTGAGRTGAGLRARGRGPPGAAAGVYGRSGLPSSADFMVPPAGAEGPKVSPLPQTAAGGPSGNLEGTGKLVTPKENLEPVQRLVRLAVQGDWRQGHRLVSCGFTVLSRWPSSVV